MIRSFFSDFFYAFFPETCVVCNVHLRNSEQAICTACLIDMPRVYFHNQDRNPLEDLLWGQVPYVRASSLFYYTKKNAYASLLYQVKYKNRPDIGLLLGEIFASELKSSGFLDDVDVIVPIPLHKKRVRERGYNQSELIAQGMSTYSSIPYSSEDIIRVVHTQTQTRKNKEERQKNVTGIFSLTPDHELAHKHILLLDDVITTGATCISCAETIISHVPSARVSIASIGLVV
jgi:ComF family protein